MIVKRWVGEVFVCDFIDPPRGWRTTTFGAVSLPGEGGDYALMF